MFLIVPLALCWGSFLNVVGFRAIRSKDVIFPSSECPHCNHALAWHDLVPVFSWIFLRGHCRYCNAPISFLYPFIELLTTLLIVLLFIHIPSNYIPAYFIFFSALIVSIRTDLEKMLIARSMTLLLIPCGITCSAIGVLPLTLPLSILGTVFGYCILWAIAHLFYTITKKDGIGQGDFELLAMIGSFTGPAGVWMSITIGSVVGSLFGIIYLLITKKGPNAKIPFGPFLALGAFIFVLYNQMITTFLDQLHPII